MCVADAVAGNKRERDSLGKRAGRKKQISEYGRVGDLGEEELTTCRKKGARGRGEGADDGERWKRRPVHN